MFNDLPVSDLPYDQDERFADLDDLVSALEAQWQAQGAGNGD